MDTKLKIMVVEDESIVALDIKNLLQKKLGYEVVAAIRSGEEAVQAAEKYNPDLILMDIILSGELTGIEAAAKIKKKLNIPIIYLTAFSDRETLRTAKLTEPYGYVLKPLEQKVLHSAIEIAVYKHNAEKKMMENEERYRMIIENSPVAIAVHCEGKIVYVNPAGVKLFGASTADQIMEKPVIDFIHRDHRNIVRERLDEVRTRGMSIEGIAEKLIRIDGKELDVETAALPTKFNDKPAIEIVIRDITEIKRKDKIQKLLLKILQTLNLNTSTGEFFKVFYHSLKELIPLQEFSIAFYSRRTGEISYLFYQNSKGEEHRELLSGLIEYTIKKNRTVFLRKEDIKHLKNTGEIFKYSKVIKEWISVPIDINDENIGVIASENHEEKEIFGPEERELFELFAYSLSRAIAKKINDEEKEKAFKRLEELNAAKNKFFSSLSHDLKNSLNSLLGYSDLLKNDMERLSEDEVKTSVDSVYSGIRKTFSLIENLLRFTRYSSGDYSPKLKIVPLHELFEKDMYVVQSLAEKKQIDLEYHVSPEVTIYADEEMISSVLQNLILCAVKYSASQSKVEIKAFEENNTVHISVQDNSTGMEEYLLKNLFITRDSEGKESVKGIGFLFIREILERFGGHISVDNKPGNGSLFCLKLPSAGNRKFIFS